MRGPEKNNQADSKFKNLQNAESNYSYMNKNRHLLKDGISMKIYDGKYENLHNPTTEKNEMIWTVTEPICVFFSWKDKKGNNFGYPISFHIKPEEFEAHLNGMLKSIPAKEKTWTSYYD